MAMQTPTLIAKALGTAHVTDVEITDEAIIVTLSDGRRISNPLDWHWWLAEASLEDRAGFEIHPTTIL